MSGPGSIALRGAWEAAQGLGVLAIACALLLCLLPLRPRSGAARTLTLPTHTRIGWIALGAALLHAALLLAIDRGVREHLKPTAPVYEWAGIGALLVYAVLTIPSIERLRRRLWHRHRSFQAWHVALTCLALLLIAAHVLGTARYVRGPWAALAFAALTAAALLALLRRRGNTGARDAVDARASRLVFGRHSRRVALVVGVVVLGLGALLLPGATPALRRSPLPRTAGLPLDFPHERHRAVRCVDCHHDFLDHSGAGSCIACHRSARPDLRLAAEPRFHGFCLGCHRDPPAALTRHGPVTGCDVCHRSPDTRASSLASARGSTGLVR